MPDQTHPAEADPHAGATPEPARKGIMSDHTSNFSDRDALIAQNANLRKERAQLRKQIESLQTSVNSITAERDELAENLMNAAELLEQGDPETAGKLAELEKQLAEAKDPAGWRDKYEALAKDFKTTKHRDAFMKQAKAAGVLDEALDDAWSLAKYEAEEDEPDPAKISSVIEGLVKPRPYWLGNAKADPDGSTATAPGGAIPAPSPASKGKGPGMERGASPGGSQAAHLRVTRAQASDPAWMAANREAIAQASQAGTFSIVEG